MNNGEKLQVLYVDDEQHNLNSFKALLRMEYKIFLANSPEEAMKVLSEHPAIKVVISDQRMPGKTGVEFFTDVRARYPLPVRMLLTAYTDAIDIIEAINKGNIFRYITKPWKENEIRAAIEEAYQFYLSSSNLKIRNEELQEAYDELDTFSYTVAHDIRGPILSVLSSLDTLKNVDDREELTRFLSVLEKTMTNLNAYIINTHSYHRMQRGAVAVEDIDFESLVKSITEVSEMQRRLYQIDFDVKIEQHTSFRSDCVLLSLIIDNIVSNAFKYRSPNKPVHTVRLHIVVDDDQVMITVEDNGIGIEQNQKDKIFDLFYRGESLAPGSGYGLFNVNKAVKKLRGLLEVESTPNVFTKFTVHIPASEI